MDLYCPAVETPTSVSSSSMEPLYDNCPPFPQRGRVREKEMESRVVCPAATRLPGSCSPLPALAPAVADVPTLVGEGRGPGAWPDHRHCSWTGGWGAQGWETEPDPGIVRARGGGGTGREQESRCRPEYRLHQNPSPPQSTVHRSTLSFYDNLPGTITPDCIPEDLDMATRVQQDLQGQMYHAWAPESIQGLTEDEEGSEGRSSWSSCEIILADGSSNHDHNPNHEKNHEQESKLDSGSCGFMEDTLMLHHQLLPPRSPQLCQAGGPASWPHSAAREQPHRVPKVPPPPPLADPSASALRSILTSLQQQIVRQNEEYEARIIR